MGETLRDRDGRTGHEFLEQLFEFEYCSECRGYVKDHDAVPMLLGAYNGYKILWFARCKKVGD